MSVHSPLDSDDEGDYIDLKCLPPVKKNMPQTYLGTTSDVQVMTVDRKFANNFQKMSNNSYGTLPRPRIIKDNVVRAKVQTIGAISNMYIVNKEDNIIEEELKYLQAVEKGNLELVEQILSSHENDTTDVTSHDHTVTGNGLKVEVEGEKKSSHSNPTFEAEQKKSPNMSGKTLIEIFQIDEKDDVQRKKSLPRMANNENSRSKHWPPTGNPRNPLPVTLIKSSGSKDYLNHQPKDPLLMDAIGPKRKSKFNKNCRDQWGRSALFISIIYHNLDMLKLLLRYQVKSEECLYHAIDFGYYDIVDIFMHYDNDQTQMVTGELSFYSPGLTPFQLAAHKNDFVMLRILHDNGYGITQECRKRAFSTKKKDEVRSDSSHVPVLDRAWDASNHQLLYYRAICSPAYLIMTFDEGLEIEKCNMDFMENIFSLYGELKRKVKTDPAVQSLYQPLADQVEEFACDLLSEVRSSSDLASFLRFDPPGQKRLTSQRNYLTPVQRAIEVRMKRFVAHDNSQLAVSSLRLGTLFDSEQCWRTSINRVLLAIMFPVLCLAFSVAPKSKIGVLLCNPIVNMTCHIMSDILFLLLMLIRLILLTHMYPCDCLGTSIYPIDYVIWIWVFARIVNQIKRFREVPIKEMVRNVWTVNDLFTSFLFLIVIGIKIYSVSAYIQTDPYFCPATTTPNNTISILRQKNITQMQFENLCTRSRWTSEQAWPVTISEAALAVIYFLIHIRAMELLYTDRTFGPLQLSLDKMLVDTIRFLSIFFVTFVGFAFAMTQLYWAWGKRASFTACGNTPLNDIKMCTQDTNSESSCLPVYSSILNSILEQYWTLYGYGWAREPPSAAIIPCDNNGDHKGITEIAGVIVSMIFHAWAVVVMLNMLVAMLSHSFDRVRNNAELEWKFHRTRTWMKFIRKGVYPRPPPMNLVPSTRDIRSFYSFLTKRFQSCFRKLPSRHNAQREASEGSQKENLRYRQALKNITHRYTRRYLLPDFQHKELEQQPLCGRRASVTVADESSI